MKLFSIEAVILNKMDSYDDEPFALITRPPTPEPEELPRNALLDVILAGNIVLLQIYIEHGHDVNRPSGNNDITPLICAVNIGRLDIVHVLLEEGAFINCADNKGNTPLLLAYCSRQKEIVILLLRKGANTRLPNNVGQTFEDLVFGADDVEYFLLMQKPDLKKITLFASLRILSAYRQMQSFERSRQVRIKKKPLS